MKISNKIKLKILQRRLEARGAKDIMFCWARDKGPVTDDQVAEDVIHALESYLDGKFHPLSEFNDKGV